MKVSQWHALDKVSWLTEVKIVLLTFLKTPIQLWMLWSRKSETGQQSVASSAGQSGGRSFQSIRFSLRGSLQQQTVWGRQRCLQERMKWTLFSEQVKILQCLQRDAAYCPCKSLLHCSFLPEPAEMEPANSEKLNKLIKKNNSLRYFNVCTPIFLKVQLWSSFDLL